MKSEKLILLKERIQTILPQLGECELCPRKCKANRLNNETGFCCTGKKAKVSSFGPHFGEESPLVGKYGSGTIFFTHCNLLCNFCQNYDISHQGNGTEVSDDQLAEIMLNLQNRGCHNINFVTPSHVVPQIMNALYIAIQNGLNIPIVYNTGGYDNVSTIKLLEGIVDIYMPDFKFWASKISKETTNTEDYSLMTKSAIKEMHRQVGDLKTDFYGIAEKGLLVRHLVLPNKLADTRKVMNFLANEISTNTYVNIMAQYRPCGEAFMHPDLSRHITDSEYREAIEIAEQEGITRLDR